MTTWQRSDTLAAVEYDASIVLLDLANLTPDSIPLVLEGPAGLVWAALDAPRSTAEIVEAVRAQVDPGAAEQVARDVPGFLEELATAGLVVRLGPVRR